MADSEIKSAPADAPKQGHVAAASASGPSAPRHVAIIMDGNGRWAKQRGLPRAIGHSKGVEAVRRTVRAAIDQGVRFLTIYSFSSENWSRPADEVEDLMGLMKRFIRRDLADLHRIGVAVRVIGARDNLDPELLAMIADAERLTAANTALTLVVAFNYGSRDEITVAARRLAERVAAGELAPAEISQAMIADCLETRGIPDPDLLIRTSGELRLSNFLLWQAAYTEFVFLENYWPEFGHDLLAQAIATYHARDRRYGGLSQRSPA